jgi:DNA-binding response OmpR family regulator
MTTQTKPYIVIAEDDRAYGHVYLNKLTAEGFDVTLVNNGAKVMPALLERKPQLLVLDLVMPEMTGFDVLEKIRQNPELADLRVIVASNLSQDVDKEKVAKYQVYDYFVKSDVSIGEVVERIRSALSDK